MKHYFILERPTQNGQTLKAIAAEGKTRGECLSIVEGVNQRGGTFLKEYPPSKYRGEWHKHIDAATYVPGELEVFGFIDLSLEIIDTLQRDPKLKPTPAVDWQR